MAASTPGYSVATPARIVELAARYGLEADAPSVVINEAGLDYRVAFVRSTDGGHWVLRVPRRPLQAGGRQHPHLAERWAALAASAPLAYGIFALRSGDPPRRAVAAAQLNPPA